MCCVLGEGENVSMSISYDCPSYELNFKYNILIIIQQSWDPQNSNKKKILPPPHYSTPSLFSGSSHIYIQTFFIIFSSQVFFFLLHFPWCLPFWAFLCLPSLFPLHFLPLSLYQVFLPKHPFSLCSHLHLPFFSLTSSFFQAFLSPPPFSTFPVFVALYLHWPTHYSRFFSQPLLPRFPRWGSVVPWLLGIPTVVTVILKDLSWHPLIWENFEHF